jgi:hypothetical protein
MTVKMKRNYNFDDHAGAAIDASAHDGSKTVIPPNPSIQKLSGIKVTDLGEVEEDRAEMEPDEEPQDSSNDSKRIYSTYCELVSPMSVMPGRIEISSTHIFFFEDRSRLKSNKAPKEKKWAIEQIREVHLRRYLLRRSALEFFLIDQTNFFLNFKKRDRNKVYNKIIQLRPPKLVYCENGSPEEILKRSQFTRMWQLRQISNFEYLMQLNTIAGKK